MDDVTFALRNRSESSTFGPIVTCVDMVDVEIPPPAVVTGLDLLRSETRVNIGRPRNVRFPPIEYYTVQRALLIGQCLVVSETGEAIRETIAPHRQAQYNFRPTKSIREIDGFTLVLPVDVPAMSHFLFEGLSRLVPGLPDIENIIIPTAPHPGFADLIAFALGRQVNVLFRSPDLFTETWFLKHALVPIYRFNFHPAMATSITNIIAACQREREGASDYLYISRRDAIHYRVMLNEDRIIALLGAMGFDILELGSMAEAEIVRRFSSAKMIVGPMGAGLYNCIFSPPGCTVVALCAPNYLRSFLDQCAALRGVRRAYCFGPDFLSYEAEHLGGHNDFVIDEDAVLETVLSLLDDAGSASTAGPARQRPVGRGIEPLAIWGRLFGKTR